jgi:hypothetical protein
MSDSESQQQSRDHNQKDVQEAKSKDPTQPLHDEEIGDAADPSSTQVDGGDNSIESELEGKNSSDGNEVA